MKLATTWNRVMLRDSTKKRRVMLPDAWFTGLFGWAFQPAFPFQKVKKGVGCYLKSQPKPAFFVVHFSQLLTSCFFWLWRVVYHCIYMDHMLTVDAKI